MTNGVWVGITHLGFFVLMFRFCTSRVRLLAAEDRLNDGERRAVRRRQRVKHDQNVHAGHRGPPAGSGTEMVAGYVETANPSRSRPVTSATPTCTYAISAGGGAGTTVTRPARRMSGPVCSPSTTSSCTARPFEERAHDAIHGVEHRGDAAGESAG